jgi:chitodextrinase
VVALESSPGTPVAEPSCDHDPVTGAGSTAVERIASGLAPNTAYVYHVVATNSSGTSTSAADQKFATLPSPPIAVFSTMPAHPMAASAITFDASRSADTDGTILIYIWNFGDGAYGVGVSTSHVYRKAGKYTVTLEVLDSKGLSASTRRVIDVNPLANAFSVVRIRTVRNGIALMLRAPDAGRFRARATVISRAHAHKRASFLLYGAASGTARASGVVQLIVRPRDAMRATPRHRGALRHIDIAVTFTPRGGVPLTKHVIVFAM